MKSSAHAIKIEIIGHPKVKPGLVVTGDFDPKPEHRSMKFTPGFLWKQLHDDDSALRSKVILERWEVLDEDGMSTKGGASENGPVLSPGQLLRLYLAKIDG
jgi:hypothetical protein